MFVINNDIPYLVMLPNDEMAYKATSTYVFKKFLTQISNDNDDLSKIKLVILDDFYDSEENSGAILFLDAYEIDTTAKVSAPKKIFHFYLASAPPTRI
jgi:hypothetical protein